MSVFIPSRDRALQLDATLRSFSQNCTDNSVARVSVLVSATTAGHRRAYQLLAREHPHVRLVREASFAQQVRRLLGAHPATVNRGRSVGAAENDGATVQLLAVDDSMFVERFSLEPMASALSREREALGFSLRLGETITFCQPLGIHSSPPELTHVSGAGDNEIVSFRWPGQQPDWGYPFDLSSSLYRRQELARLLGEITFDSPTTLEHGLWLTAGTLENRSRLLCYRRPKAVSLALNRVQSVAPNPTSGHRRHEPATLLQAYLDGWRVDVGAYDGYVPHACHEEAELILRRMDHR